MSALSVRGLTLAHAGRLVVEDVSFSAPAGAVTAVLGAAGAGKTMLLAGIAGLVPAVRGTVLVDGEDMTARRGPARRIGLLAPGTDLGAGKSVGAALGGVAGRRHREQLAPLLAALGLADLRERKLNELSHGEGYLVLAAARLLAGGDVTLVDEAGTGLDDAAWWALRTALTDLASAGRTCVIAGRGPSVMAEAGHAVLVHAGRVVQAGPPDLLYARPRDPLAAALTGPANILSGTLRQKIPGGFVWMSDGLRFRQEAGGAVPVPTLGASVQLCLRPDHVTLAAPPEADVNRLPGTVESLSGFGATAAALVQTALGPLRAVLPACYRPGRGEPVTLAWSTGAASVLSEPLPAA